MAQHFLKTQAARSLSIAKVAAMTDEDAFESMKVARWPHTDGNPICPRCNCIKSYALGKRKTWRCAGCQYQFSVTSQTIFQSSKIPLRTWLLAIAIFSSRSQGISALQLSRDLGVQYKTAFVMCHKLRGVLGIKQDELELSGTVEVDGAYFGGYLRHENLIRAGMGHRITKKWHGNRRVVVVARQRGGRTITFNVARESEAVFALAKRLRPGTIISADQAHAWDCLKEAFEMLRINHHRAFKISDACTNMAESYFSRLRRAHGVHHLFSAKYLQAYASEVAWREDMRRTASAEVFRELLGACLGNPPVRRWVGYWQRVSETVPVAIEAVKLDTPFDPYEASVPKPLAAHPACTFDNVIPMKRRAA